MKKLGLLLTGLIVAATVVAQPGGRHGRHGDHGPEGSRGIERIEERLNLTEAQKTQMESLRNDHLESIRDIGNTLDIKRAQLKAAIATDTPDTKEIDGLVAEINNLNNEKFKQWVDHTLKVRGMLDDDQKLIFDRIHHNKRMHHRGRG